MRIYNLDTWRLVTEGHGGSLVEIYIKEIVRYDARVRKLAFDVNPPNDTDVREHYVCCFRSNST